MSIIAENLNDVDYYELNELGKQYEYPVFIVSKAIEEAVGPVVGDPQLIKQIYPGFKEIVKDMDEHGTKRSPRSILISKGMGHRVVIDTFNEIKKRSKHNRLGRYMLENTFGPAYTSETVGNVYHGHLVIEKEQLEQQRLRQAA